MKIFMLSPQGRHKIKLLTEGSTCIYCNRDLLADLESFVSSSLDHILPRAAGGTSDLGNLGLCCFVCNRLKDSNVFDTIRDARKAIAVRRSIYRCQYAVALASVRLALPAPRNGGGA